MTLDDLIGNSHKETLIKYWMEKAQESLESAKSEYKADRLSPAVNRIYYACFYAASAVMRSRGRMYKKHKGIRSAIHRELINGSVLNADWGHFYDEVFDSRQRGDYQPMVKFESEQVRGYIDQAKGFLKEMEKLLLKPKDS